MEGRKRDLFEYSLLSFILGILHRPTALTVRTGVWGGIGWQ